MTVWPNVRLGEVLSHHQEYVSEPAPRLYPKLSVRLYGRGVVLDTPADGATLRMRRHQIARAGQVILSEIWGKKGAIGLVPNEGEGALCTSHFFLFNLHPDRVLPAWLQLVFSANYLQEQLDAEAKGTTGYASVRPRNLLACEIPLPPLAEQRRIVARIEELVARIDEARALRQLSVEESQAFLVSSLAAAMLDVAVSHADLESLCEVIIDNLHSNPKYAEGGVPCVRSPDVGWGKLDLTTALCTDEAEYARRTVRGAPQVDDIVFVREGGGTGKSALVEPGQRFSLGQRVMMLRPRQSSVVPRFLLYQLLSPLVQDDQIAPLCKGSASPHLNISSLKRFRVRVPSIADQRRIVGKLDALQARAGELQGQQALTGAELSAALPSIIEHAFRARL